jgi:hypothetical protein
MAGCSERDSELPGSIKRARGPNLLTSLAAVRLFKKDFASVSYFCTGGYLNSVKMYNVWQRTGRPGFDSRQRRRIFPLTSASRPALRPAKPPIQGVPGARSPGVKGGRGVRLTTHPLLVPRLRKIRSYTSCHPSACMERNGTTLPFTFLQMYANRSHVFQVHSLLVDTCVLPHLILIFVFVAFFLCT